MDLCNNGHEEVCYESRNCPACSYAENAAMEAREEMQEQLEKEEEKTGDLEDEVLNLKEELGNIRGGLIK